MSEQDDIAMMNLTAWSARQWIALAAYLGCDPAELEGVNILHFVMIVQQIVEAHDTGNIAFDSPEIGGHDDIPPHRWHEEWLYSARQALAQLPERKT